MRGMHASAHTLRLSLPRSWRTQVFIVLAVVTCHAILLYGLFHARAATSITDGPPMFGPIILNEWRDLHQRAVTSRRWSPPMQEDQSTSPSRHWQFPPVDVWPSSASTS